MLRLVPDLVDHDMIKKRHWQKIAGQMIYKILDYTEQTYGASAIHEAFDDFYLNENPNGFDPQSDEMPLFMPWFFFEWFPEPEVTLLPDAPPAPPAVALLRSHQDLSDDELKYLVECCETSFSFFEILQIELNRSLKLKDILTEEIHLVIETQATQGPQPGNIIFGKVITIDGIGSLEACAPIMLVPECKIPIIELRQQMQKEHPKINQIVLHQWAFETLDLYRTIFDELTKPNLPIIQNTDGHVMCMCEMLFKIEDPQKTFDAIYRMAQGYTKKELLKNAKYNKKDELIAIEFPWVKKGNKMLDGWEFTEMGFIQIAKNRMTVQTNSAERAKKFQSELKKRMPNGWALIQVVTEPFESALDKVKPGLAAKNRKRQEDLEADPEILKKMESLAKAHWDKWIYEPVPALGGLKPVDAVKTKDGREMLDALLIQFELEAARQPMIGQTVDTIRAVRARLGL